MAAAAHRTPSSSQTEPRAHATRLPASLPREGALVATVCFLSLQLASLGVSREWDPAAFVLMLYHNAIPLFNKKKLTVAKTIT